MMGSTKNTDFSRNHSRPYNYCPEQLLYHGEEGPQGGMSLMTGDCQLTLFIVDADHHGKGGPQGDDTADGTG
jgi:hypothetical protein